MTVVHERACIANRDWCHPPMAQWFLYLLYFKRVITFGESILILNSKDGTVQKIVTVPGYLGLPQRGFTTKPTVSGAAVPPWERKQTPTVP